MRGSASFAGFYAAALPLDQERPRGIFCGARVIRQTAGHVKGRIVLFAGADVLLRGDWRTAAVGHNLAVAAGDWGGCIVAIAKTRDHDAFAALFRHFAPRVKTYLMRCHMEAGAAEEVAQETMLIVWRKADKFDPARAAASTWIFTIARNRRVDALRGARHPDALIDMPIESEQPSPSDLMLGAEREARAHQALGALPEDQAEVVRLSFFEDRPHSVIARELGIPLGTVKSRLRLAFARLKSALEPVA